MLNFIQTHPTIDRLVLVALIVLFVIFLRRLAWKEAHGSCLYHEWFPHDYAYYGCFRSCKRCKHAQEWHGWLRGWEPILPKKK